VAWLAVAGVDRITKVIASARLELGQSVPLLPFLHLTLVHNEGAAFGLFTGMRWGLAALNALVAVGVFFLAPRLAADGPLPLLALGLIGGGAAGNLIDRAAFGYVVDFLDWRIWPVSNVADVSIVIGGALLAWHLLRLTTPAAASKA
jgi:signal peptidase II